MRSERRRARLDTSVTETTMSDEVKGEGHVTVPMPTIRAEGTFEEIMPDEEVARLMGRYGYEPSMRTRSGTQWRSRKASDDRFLFIPSPTPRIVFNDILAREKLDFNENQAVVEDTIASIDNRLEKGRKAKEAIDAWLSRQLHPQQQ
jgi:hypothetical protein